MIPKKIHYCWFGRGQKPKLAEKCIKSWQKFCPDFEIIEWNEDNFNLYEHPYTKFCYENKKWAYLSDFVRLKVVCEQGGIYFDTDVEVIKPVDKLLNEEAFYGLLEAGNNLQKVQEKLNKAEILIKKNKAKQKLIEEIIENDEEITEEKSLLWIT